MDLRKIDSLIAEKVMGWGLKELNVCSAWIDNQNGWCLKQLWNPSRDMRDAWKVVKKLNEIFTVDVQDTLNDGASCCLYEFQEETESLIPYSATEAETAPLAICLAALKSVGVEVEG